jgi:hypothetical protein
MVLLLAATAPHQVLELALHVVEGVAQRNPQVFVLHALRLQCMTAGQGQADAHAERTALLLVLGLLIDDDAARHDVAGKPLEVSAVATHGLLDEVAARKAFEGDLQRLLHALMLPARARAAVAPAQRARARALETRLA